jgi:hypothetical protein
MKILYSPGYGAGWSTWSSGEIAELMLTYQPIIDAIEAGEPLWEGNLYYFDESKIKYHQSILDLKKEAKEKFGVNYVCIAGIDQLKVMEVFGEVEITERDGFEFVEELRHYDD